MEQLKYFIVAIMVFCSCNVLFAGTLVFDYGFEDWSGWSGTASPADGWIFSQPSVDYFIDNRDSTIGTMGGVNCDGNTAYSGSYYYHTQFYTGATDSCLGHAASSINHRMFIGYNGEYPDSGTRNTTLFNNVVTSSSSTLRFRFRCTGDWTSTNSVMDGGGGEKFIRWPIGQEYYGDANNLEIKILVDGDSENGQIGIHDYNYGGSQTTHFFPTAINWQDGNWHSFVMLAEATAPQTFLVSIYLDDWEMASSALASWTCHLDPTEAPTNQFYAASFNGNWSANYPVALIGMDFDDIQVWDGLPDSSTQTYCTDADSDGYYVDGSCASFASDPGGSYRLLSVMTAGGDCNDSDAAINPGATESCNNTIDDNCNNLIDCNDPTCSGDSSCQTIKAGSAGLGGGTCTVGGGYMTFESQ